jgi:hypothetical protein
MNEGWGWLDNNRDLVIVLVTEPVERHGRLVLQSIGGRVMSKTNAAIIGGVLAWIASTVMAIYTAHRNRQLEMDANEKSGTVSRANIDWSIIHIRDDVGGIHNLITITNALLAAILGALLF